MAHLRKISPLLLLRMAAGFLLVCICVVIARFIYLYWGSFWNSAHTINFLVAWIPSVLSVLVAFVPEKDLERRMRLRWRFAVVAFGFIYSLMLWHQQGLNDLANSQQTQTAISTAVSQANDHSDKQFDRTQGQITDVRNNLEATEKNLASKVDESTSTISTGLGKVGKPEPPELPRLEFSLWKDNIQEAEFPILTAIVQQEDDGTIPVEYFFRNSSSVSADSVEVWVHICSLCSFAKEPDGFEKPAGINEQSRHRVLSSFNPGVSFQKSEVAFKFNSPTPIIKMQVFKVGISFSYSCKNCGGAKTTRDFMLSVIPSLGQVSPNLPQAPHPLTWVHH
jgi:hypothetical protein